MITSTRVRRIFLVEHGVDFRRWHTGLLSEAYRLNLDPYQGDLLLFVGRKRNRIKVLYADPTGLWVSAKVFTLETMKTRFRFAMDPTCKSITEGELSMLLEGSAYTLTKQVAHYSPKKLLTNGGISTQSP